MSERSLDTTHQVKPLSANRLWGFNFKTKKSFKSQAYVDFQHEIRDDLMGKEWTFGEEKLLVEITAAFSNKAADLDNCIKGLLDTYQFVFEEFNDKHVWKIKAEKQVVRKGDEFIRIRISELQEQSKVQEQELESSDEQES